MNELITPEEQSVSFGYGVTEPQYKVQRESFCRTQGQSWAQLSSLNREDLKVIRMLGQDPKEFQSTKLKLLAEQVIFNYEG